MYLRARVLKRVEILKSSLIKKGKLQKKKSTYSTFLQMETSNKTRNFQPLWTCLAYIIDIFSFIFVATLFQNPILSGQG